VQLGEEGSVGACRPREAEGIVFGGEWLRVFNTNALWEGGMVRKRITRKGGDAGAVEENGLAKQELIHHGGLELLGTAGGLFEDAAGSSISVAEGWPYRL